MQHRILGFTALSVLLLISNLGLPHPGYCNKDSVDPIPTLTQTANAFSAIIEQAKPAVVNILVKKETAKDRDGNDIHQDFFETELMKDFFGSVPKQQKKSKKEREAQYGNGSGFIISADGYVITNHHVVKDAVEITLYLQDKREFKAKLIGSDPQSDIALLQIPESGLPTLPLGNSNKLRVGEWAIAIGSPLEFIQTVTVGIISARGRSSVGISEYEDFIQTDAAINPGNSGGPLLNIHGEVIGINTAFMTQSGGYMGVGFAVPISMAKIITGQLQKYGKMTRGWLGVALKDVTPAELQSATDNYYHAAAKVVGVSEDSPAYSAGLKKNDLIIAVNNISILGAADLRNRIALTEPNTKVTIQFLRNGGQKKATLRLKELQH